MANKYIEFLTYVRDTYMLLPWFVACSNICCPPLVSMIFDGWARGCRIIFFVFVFETPVGVQNVVVVACPFINIGFGACGICNSWIPLVPEPFELVPVLFDGWMLFGLAKDCGTTCRGDVGPLFPPFAINGFGDSACTFWWTIPDWVNIVWFCSCLMSWGCTMVADPPGAIYKLHFYLSLKFWPSMPWVYIIQ